MRKGKKKLAMCVTTRPPSSPSRCVALQCHLVCERDPCLKWGNGLCLGLELLTSAERLNHHLQPTNTPTYSLQGVIVRRTTTIEWVPVVRWVPASSTTVSVKQSSNHYIPAALLSTDDVTSHDALSLFKSHFLELKGWLQCFPRVNAQLFVIRGLTVSCHKQVEVRTEEGNDMETVTTTTTRSVPQLPAMRGRRTILSLPL